ncbi:MAG: hypothetical protein QOI30_2795, partial [Mycobacterium sp.]|nr:hypothetical protein [Mycobacterium sp.]
LERFADNEEVGGSSPPRPTTMCSPRRFVRLVLPLAAIAVLAVVIRSQRGVEVWHVAADQTGGRREGP